MIKWLLLVVVAGAALLAVFTKKTFVVERVIPASKEDIWAVIADTAAYPEWNPVFTEVNGVYKEGAKLINKVRDPENRIIEMTATVKRVDEPNELNQVGGIPGIITFNHRWLLETVDGGTKVTQHEVDRGIGLWFWNSDWIEPSYNNVLVELEKRLSVLESGPSE